MTRLSHAASRLEGQKMFQILAQAQELERSGRSIIHFEIGDPDFNTPKNIVNAIVENTISIKVIGSLRFLDFFNVKNLNKIGSMVYAIITTDTNPIIEITAIDFNAGCFAIIKIPTPIIVVKTDKKMDVL